MALLPDFLLISGREKNKENAKRSRLRKKFLLESLKQRVAALQRENALLSSLLRERLPDVGEALLADRSSALAVALPECADDCVSLGAVLRFGSALSFEGQGSEGSESDEPPAKALAIVESLSESITRANWTAFIESNEKSHYPTRRLSFLRLAQLAGRTNIDLSDCCHGRGG